MLIFPQKQDDELDDETKSLLNSSHEDAVLDPIHEDAVLKTPPRSKSPEPIIDTSTTQQKKVVLKRKLIIATPSSASDDKTIEQSSLAESTPAKLAKTPISIAALNDDDKTVETQLTKSVDDEDDTDGNKKAVKLTGLTAKERLEMRAKKFGGATVIGGGGDAMKLARAERFGITSPASGDIKNGSEVSVDVLKKRAERFGGSVSKVMNKIENLEKLQKRQQRFGNAAATNKTKDASASSGAASKDYEEKARLRLERFNKAAVK